MLKNENRIKKYHLIDPWRHLEDWNKPANEENNVFTKMFSDVQLKLNCHAHKLEYHRGTTLEVIDNFSDSSLDFGYIDGDHSLKGILIDLICWYEKIKCGGFLGGDDCDFEPFQHSIKYEPTLVFPAVLYFAEAVGGVIYLLPFNQFLLHKTSDRVFKVINLSGQKFDESMTARMSFSAFGRSVINSFLSKLKR